MTKHLCEYRDFDGGALCGAPASRRLTGEKYGEEPWTLLICDDHRHSATYLMELQGWSTRKEVCLLDCAEGQIANLEDWLLDAVRCFVGDSEPKSGDGLAWLDALLDGINPGYHRDATLPHYILNDHGVNAAVKAALAFYDAQYDGTGDEGAE